MVQPRENFELFLEESFAEGQYCRELRLSPDELQYLQIYYPRVHYTAQGGDAGGKTWYLVSLLP